MKSNKLLYVSQGTLSQAHKVPLRYTSAPPPDRVVVLLSTMSQLLSVCIPSDFHGGERPRILLLTLPHMYSGPELRVLSGLRGCSVAAEVGLEPTSHSSRPTVFNTAPRTYWGQFRHMVGEVGVEPTQRISATILQTAPTLQLRRSPIRIL